MSCKGLHQQNVSSKYHCIFSRCRQARHRFVKSDRAKCYTKLAQLNANIMKVEMKAEKYRKRTQRLMTADQTDPDRLITAGQTDPDRLMSAGQTDPDRLK